MFFEYNNTIFDSVKLERKRILSNNFLIRNIEEYSDCSRLYDGLFFDEDSLQVIELRTIKLEDYILNNFSF